MSDSSADKPQGPVARRADGVAAAVGGRPNPQGKGVVGLLRDWDETAPRGVVAKPPPQLLADYFTSLLVLSAAFKFKPAFGTRYYLYCEEPEWTLSLVSPEEWQSPRKARAFVGTCVLHADSTWTISPSENVTKPGPVADAVADFYRGFADRLQSSKPLEDELPFYERELPYYQRLFAAALSRSLTGSLTIGGQLGIDSRQWLASLPRDGGRLIAAAPAESPQAAGKRPGSRTP